MNRAMLMRRQFLSSQSKLLQQYFCRDKILVHHHSVGAAFVVQQQEQQMYKLMCQQQQRFMASSAMLLPKKKKKVDDKNAPLLNQDLIRYLTSQDHESSTLDSIQIRLVYTNLSPVDNNEPPPPQVMSLQEALNLSDESDLDLVGIALDQSPPVIRICHFTKWVYQREKQSRKLSSNNNSSTTSSSTNKNKTSKLKAWNFRASIEQHDLERKLKQLWSYLSKGHVCQVSISCSMRQFRQDNQVVQTTMERIQSQLQQKRQDGNGNTTSNNKNTSAINTTNKPLICSTMTLDESQRRGTFKIQPPSTK